MGAEEGKNTPSPLELKRQQMCFLYQENKCSPTLPRYATVAFNASASARCSAESVQELYEAVDMDFENLPGDVKVSVV